MAVEDPLVGAGVREGTLGEIPLPNLLRSLAASRSHGILHLSGSYSSIVCFRDGGIYLAHAETGPSLRQVFLSSGVSEEKWDSATEATRQGGTLIEALLAVGEASPERIRSALYEHTLSTLFELLVPNSNLFRFGADETHQLGAAFLFPVDDVLDAATNRLAEFTEIARSVPSTATVMGVSPRLPVGAAEIRLTAIEWQVLAAIDGRASVAEIITTVGQSAFTVFSTLHHLLQVGAIGRVGPD